VVAFRDNHSDGEKISCGVQQILTKFSVILIYLMKSITSEMAMNVDGARKVALFLEDKR
jgi:hypothetical protein